MSTAGSASASIARDAERRVGGGAQALPGGPQGQLTHAARDKVSDSQWHQQLSGLDRGAEERSAYWLVPFKNYKTMCPYLVGSYERVGAELARYFERGFTTMILDVPRRRGSRAHLRAAFDGTAPAHGASSCSSTT